MRSLVILAALASSLFAARVDMSWTAAAQNPAGTGYNVYRAPGTCAASGQTFTKLNPAPLPGLTYADSSVINGTSYCYYATATFGAQESGPSQKATAIIPLDAPPTFTIQVNIAATITVNGQQLAAGQQTITVPVGGQ